MSTSPCAGFDVPHDWPADATFDLVVVSEVGYFLSPAELETLISRIARLPGPAGVVVLCHWRHRVEGWLLDADEVHTSFEDSRLPGLSATYRDRDVEIRVHAYDDGWPDHSAERVEGCAGEGLPLSHLRPTTALRELRAASPAAPGSGTPATSARSSRSTGRAATSTVTERSGTCAATSPSPAAPGWRPARTVSASPAT